MHIDRIAALPESLQPRALELAAQQWIGACPRCGKPVTWAGVGRKPRWCSPTCRQRAKEARRAARDNERPLSVADGPARPHNAAAWAALLTDPSHSGLLEAVLNGMIRESDDTVHVPPVGDELVEKMFGLPPGSGVALRLGLPLPDAEQREQRRLQFAHRTRNSDRPNWAEHHYQCGWNAGYSHAQAEARAAALPIDSPPSRQQRRAAEREALKQRHRT
jgi:hypothetical protein